MDDNVDGKFDQSEFSIQIERNLKGLDNLRKFYVLSDLLFSWLVDDGVELMSKIKKRGECKYIVIHLGRYVFL